jgi:hypothetical protein
MTTRSLAGDYRYRYAERGVSPLTTQSLTADYAEPPRLPRGVSPYAESYRTRSLAADYAVFRR